MLTGESDTLNEDIGKRRNAWVAESTCPDIRPFDEDLFADVSEQIQNQQAYIDKTVTEADEAFTTSLYQMEIDRWATRAARRLAASGVRTKSASAPR